MSDKITIQQSSKPIKAAAALSKLGLIASICVALFVDGDAWKSAGVAGIFIFGLAVILTRWIRWWQHG